MARTSPVHAGYTILSGSGSGSNGHRIDVWVEYLVGDADVANNRTWLTAYFYAALNPNYSSSTSYYNGLNSTFTVDGAAATGVSNGSYDFTSSAKVNLLGSFDGYIGHDDDGTKSVQFEGSFTTVSSYISGGRISETVSLPDIARASSVTAWDVPLGSACCVSWTPALARHSFSLQFSLGDWVCATDILSPNTTGKYTYTGLTLPLEAARQFSGTSAAMTVELTTYDGSTALGTSSDSFNVTVPENADTRPAVTAALTAACDAFPGRFIQRLSKVSAAVTAQDPLGAAITGYRITAGSSTVSGTVSDFLDKSGTVTVTVTAVNSRGFTGTYSQDITVLPYESPRLLTSAAYRCLSDGSADPGGTFLRIAADWESSPVEGLNTCRLDWRYKQAGGQYSDWQTLSSAGSLDTGAMAGPVLERDTAYTVELLAVDTAGGTSTATFSIPMEQVYMHRTKNAMGLGGYAQGENVLDVHWDLHARQNIACDRAVSGLYIRTAQPFGTHTLRVQTQWSDLNGDGNSRQSVFLFGNDNGTLIRGIIGINSAGGVGWDGTSGVTVAADSATGIVTVTLPYIAYDRFVLLSGDYMDVL